MVLSFFVLLSAVLFAMYSSGVRGGKKAYAFAYNVWPPMNSRRIEVGGMAAISAGESSMM